MAQRRHHYERAFEAYLRERRIPYVAVNEARKALLPHGARLRLDGAGDAGPDLKSFDFVVYGENTNMLIEIKGRKVPARKGTGRGRGGGRLESWVTLDDVASLRAQPLGAGVRRGRERAAQAGGGLGGPVVVPPPCAGGTGGKPGVGVGVGRALINI